MKLLYSELLPIPNCLLWSFCTQVFCVVLSMVATVVVADQLPYQPAPYHAPAPAPYHAPAPAPYHAPEPAYAPAPYHA